MVLPDCVWALLDAERYRMFRDWQIPSPEEIRFRINYPCCTMSAGRRYDSRGDPVHGNELDRMITRATKASLYAHEEELSRGYLHVSSGVRLGICGQVYHRNGSASGIRSVTSLCIRIPHEVPHCADDLLTQISKDGFQNTLIVSPPGNGKTTLLRAIIQNLSEDGHRVAVADERGEIAAASERNFGFDLGPNTDVMTGGSKLESAMILLRAMNPEVLAFDEITSPNDIDMITRAAGCGVSLLATAHGSDLRNMKKRSLYRELFDTGIFDTVVWIYQRNEKRIYVPEKL